MYMLKISVLIAAGILFFFTSLLQSQEAPAIAEFGAYDVIKNRNISFSERKALLESRKQELLKWDKNGDGKLDADEREAWKRARQEYYLKIKKQKQMDNPNTEAARLFKKHDLNHDGHLNQTEKAALEADLVEMQARKQLNTTGK